MNEDFKILKSEIVSGKYVNLRIASEADAAFILELRLNPLLNKFIGTTDPSLEKQQQWIKKSFENANDFHFIIEDKDAVPCGTVAVYNINFNDSSAEWGRWVIKPNTPVFISIESTILILYFAFRKLKLKRLYGGANKLNAQVIKYHKLYADVTSEDETTINFDFAERNLKKLADKFKNFHNLQNELNI